MTDNKKQNYTVVEAFFLLGRTCYLLVRVEASNPGHAGVVTEISETLALDHFPGHGLDLGL